MSPKISIVAAIGLNNELGKNNQLLWSIPTDMKRFREITSGHVVIMGRKTFDSIPEKFRPLPNRTNIIVSRNGEYNYENTYVCRSLEEAIERAKEFEKEEIFIIGGGQIYSEGIKFTDKLYLTVIQESTDADVFFPNYDQFKNIISKVDGVHNGLKYSWIDLEK